MDLHSLTEALKPDAIAHAAGSSATAVKSVLAGGKHHHTAGGGGPSSTAANGKDPAADPTMQATATVFNAIQGHWLSASLHVMLRLRIADILLAARDVSSSASGKDQGSAAPRGGMHIEQLAAACGATSPGAQSHLYKVLRVLAQHELLDERPGRVFAPNTATAQLAQGEAPSLGHMAAHLINKPKWDAWGLLPEAVQQGKTAFVLAHGMNVYEFGELPEQAAFGDEFCKAMSFFTRHSLTGGTTSLQAAYDWRGARVIMDVGGGRGELLSAAMSWSGDQCKGLILDRQMVINSIDIPGMFEAKGVVNAADRLTLMAGDVRKPFPKPAQDAQVDTLLMKHFLSAFDDDNSVTIIQHCKQCLAPGGRILLLQTLVPEPGDRSLNTREDGVAPGLFAIEILAQCPGGAWRTLFEWQELFERAGMQLQSNTAVGCNMNLMVWKQ